MIDYHHDTGLSCDDTKVEEGLHLYYNSEQKKYFLVGAVGEPTHIPDPKNVKQIFEDPKVIKVKRVSSLCYLSPTE